LVYQFEVEKPVIQDSVIDTKQGVPFSIPLLASGGVPNYTWELSKEYTVDQISAPFPSGGTSLYFNDIDTGYVPIDLPFSFPFYQDHFNRIYLSADGYIHFAIQTYFPFVYSNLIRFETTNMIAPFLSDLILLNAKIKFQNNKITLICSAKIKNQQNSYIHYAITLSNDGSILFHYGNLIYANTPFISGISNGNKADLKYSPVSNNNCNQISGQTIQFIPVNDPKTIYLNQNGILYGTCFDTIPFSIYLKCEDNNGISSQKKVKIQITPYDGLVVDHFELNDESCLTAQIGNQQTISIFIENKKDTTYRNCNLSYYFSSPYINSINNPILIDSIYPFEKLESIDQIHFSTVGSVPDHTPVRLNWVLASGEDTLNRGFYQFCLEKPQIKLVDFEFINSNSYNNQYQLEINLKNSKTCSISNIQYELTIENNTHQIVPIDTSCYTFNGFEAKKLIYSILDPDFTFSSQNRVLQLKILNNESLLQTETITIYTENEYVIKPNPTTDLFEISSLDLHNRIVRIDVFNVWGELIQSENPNTDMILLDSRDWAQGVYLIKITNQSSIVKTVKLIKL
jgi:hypothetical protein